LTAILDAFALAGCGGEAKLSFAGHLVGFPVPLVGLHQEAAFFACVGKNRWEGPGQQKGAAFESKKKLLDARFSLA